MLHWHTRPEAIEVLNGAFESSTGYGVPGGNPPPVAHTDRFKKDYRVVMAERSIWHDVRPIAVPCLPLSVKLAPFEGDQKGQR